MNARKGGGYLFLLVGLLTIVNFVLRVTGVVDWSWWLVLAPLWLYFALWIVRALIAWGFLLVLGILALLERRTATKGGRR